MVHVMQTDSSKSGSEVPLSDKTEKSSVRARGSSSPFRCIGNLVQQMNTEKDQELSLAKLHLEELEALASNRQKEVIIIRQTLYANHWISCSHKLTHTDTGFSHFSSYSCLISLCSLFFFAKIIGYHCIVILLHNMCTDIHAKH